MTETQQRVLDWVAANTGGTTPERIARDLELRQATVTRALHTLGRAGLVRSIYGPITSGHTLAAGELVYPVPTP